MKKLFDTSMLIQHWIGSGGRASAQRTFRDVERWAEELIDLRKMKAIATPVYIEFVAGVTSEGEMKMARAYLARFLVVDGGAISPSDWKEARRLAERVPRNGKPRQLADCLIRAIADRLHYDVITLDNDFPR